MKRKRKTALPRLTILAMSRRELTAFCDAVEQLVHRVSELEELVEELRARTARRPRKAAPGATAPAGDEELA